MHIEQLKCNTPITSSLAMEINVSERRGSATGGVGVCDTPLPPWIENHEFIGQI